MSDALMSEELRWMRQLLWLRHGCTGPCLYGDDGEMQCNSCLIDFKRDSVEQINKRFTEIGLAKHFGWKPDTLSIP